jgi:hypothetical protein
VSTALGNSFSYPPTIVRSLTLRTIPFWYLWCQEPLGRTVPPVVSSILSRIRYFSLPRRSGPNSAQPLTAPDQSQQHHLPHQLHQGVPAIRLSATRSTSRRGIELDWRGWRSWDLVGFGVTLERGHNHSDNGIRGGYEQRQSFFSEIDAGVDSGSELGRDFGSGCERRSRVYTLTGHSQCRHLAR